MSLIFTRHQALEMCRTSGFNLSYESLTGYNARQKLRELKTTDPDFWDQLTKNSIADAAPGPDDKVAEDEETADLPLFEDDSDLPCQSIVSEVVGAHAAGVVFNKDGDMASAAAAEALEREETTEAQGANDGVNGLGRGKRRKTGNKLYQSGFWRHRDEDASDDEGEH